MNMKNNTLIKSFAKGIATDDKRQTVKNAVIYTRVSTKEQADTNQSLETQKKYCLQYALKHDLNILGFFGGTYESAKTDERNEFNRMIRFVKNQKEGISMILVYSLDRFSRTGDNAIFISSELKKQGISIISVTQPIDVSTHSGVLQQNIQFIFSKYDNDLRREKCISGMKEKLLRGEWTGGAPVGYAYDRSGGKGAEKVVPNEKGAMIAKAFELKAQGVPATEIAIRLKTLGLKVDKKRLTEIFRNPFYCGYLSHNLLDGEVVKGKHEPLVTEEVFYLANEVLKRNSSGYKQDMKNANVPLKHFVRCSECNTPFTGYIVKKKNLYYYKCNRIGCKCNKSASSMHLQFSDLLKQYEVKSELILPLKEQLEYVCESLKDSGKESKGRIQKNVESLNEKLGRLEERFAYGEIDRDIFEKVSGKLRKEIQEASDQMRKSSFELSNPQFLIDHSLEIIANLSEFWVSGDFESKRKLQDVLFPEGIMYDKQIGDYRTTKVNSILQLTRSISNELKGNKNGQAKLLSDLSDWVVPTGIEPASKV
jgi:site-specific DNA recombinase